MANKFVPRRESDVADLVAAFPLCWLLSEANGQRFATPLPLLAECGEDGLVVSLLGHLALANPQRAALQDSPRATILCSGPQGYISPRHVSNLTWGPTWNYAVCRFETNVALVPDETEQSLWHLSAALEGTAQGDWTPERMGARYDELKHRIVAFRATVQETHPRFKLGQDENDATFTEIVGSLDDRTLADWMQRSRP